MAAQKNTTTNDNTLTISDTDLTMDNIFSRKSSFDLALRMSNAFAASTIVPKDYQNNPSNCLIALEIANRIGTSPMMVMQNLYIVNDRPAWSSQFIIAMINNSRKYKTELQYDIKGSFENLECTAFAVDHNGRKVSRPKIDMKMAKAEGWIDKSMSKWKSMPEVMIRYRAASFFGRLNFPDLIMGIYSADEVIDITEDQYRYVEPIPPSAMEIPEPADLHNQPNPTESPNNDFDSHTSESAFQNDSIVSVVNVNPINESPESLICDDCNVNITQAEKNFSVKNYSRSLCFKCQKEAKKAQ